MALVNHRSHGTLPLALVHWDRPDSGPGASIDLFKLVHLEYPLPPFPSLFKLVHYVAHSSLGKWLVGILLKRLLVAGSLEAAYSLNWGAQEIWGKGGGETLALL